MPETRDQSGRPATAIPDAHHLLLSLAGLIDDELLGWGRELVAVGETAYALELMGAAVAAERIRLPHQVHAALRTNTPPRIELSPPDPNPVMQHRFVADLAALGCARPPGASPAEVLATVPARLLKGCRLSLTWRLTPAGSASTPVPHPVLLVETTERAGNDVLAHQLTELLSQAGVFASVEVLSQHAPVGDYHRAAKDASAALETHAPPADTLAAGSAPSASPARSDHRLTRPPTAPPRVATSGAPSAQTPASHPPLGPVERVITARSATVAAPGGYNAATPFDEAARWGPQRGDHHPPVDLRQEPHLRQPRASRETLQGRPAPPQPSPDQHPSQQLNPAAQLGTHPSPPQDPGRPPIWAFGPPD